MSEVRPTLLVLDFGRTGAVDSVTSQVAVMNLEAVAVASDSLRTLQSPGRRQTFESAEKLFEVGPDHRVVAMISGDARLMAVPWSLLLGEWAASVPDPLAHVSDYSAGLVRWLRDQRDLFGRAEQDEFFAWQLRLTFLDIRERIIADLEAADLVNESWTTVEVESTTSRAVAACIDDLVACDDLLGVDTDVDAEYLRSVDGLIKEQFDWVFDDVPRTVQSDRQILTSVPALILAKERTVRSDSTVAFVGYGGCERFPVAHAITFHGIVNDVVRVSSWDVQGVDREGASRIFPFGQSDAIHLLLDGFDRAFLRSAHRAIQDVFEETYSSDANVVTSETRSDSLEVLQDEIHRRVDGVFNDHSREAFADPLLSTIAAMPRLDLAGMAASLVGLQGLRSATSSFPPAVGGPIDVALISRAHGVEWISRNQSLGHRHVGTK